MRKEPLVSIALATYNGELYLAEQINSLLTQDYPNLEIIISDDCSTDSSWSILNDYAQKDRRIRLLKQEKNLGYVKNFYRAFLECKGKYISPCDQDDIWYPNKTTRLVENIGDSLLVYCNSRIIDINSNPIGITLFDKVNMIEGSDPRKLLFSTSICGHAMLFSRQLLFAPGRITESPYIDWWIAFVASNIGSVKYLNEVLVDYRRNPQSVGNSIKYFETKKRRLVMLKQDAIRLEIFSEFPGEFQNYCIELKKAWWSWHSNFFSWKILFILIRDSFVTHYAFLASFKSYRRIFMKYIVGNKLKNFIRPKKYSSLNENNKAHREL